MTTTTATATATSGLGTLPIARTFAPTDQIARRPLEAWAAELRREIAAAASAPVPVHHRERCEELIRCGNAAALVQANAGRADAALEICEAQIAWALRLADRHDRPGLRRLVVQPWVNIGRLHAREGRLDEARRHFDEAGGCSTERPSRIAGTTIMPDDWVAEDREDGGIHVFGRTVVVIDTTRALLAARRFEELLDFAEDDPTGGVEHLEPILHEAVVVALGRLGRLDEALARADAYARRTTSWERIVLRMREAELRIAVGALDAARRDIGRLIEVCDRIDLAAKARVPYLLPVEHLLRLARAIELDRTAVDLAEKAYQAARRTEDQPLQAGLLRWLVDAPLGDRRATYAEALDRLLDSTAYARLRRAGPPTADTTELDLLQSELLTVLAE